MTTPLTLSWDLLPGLAHEIAVAADGTVWCLGTGEMPGGKGYSLHRWNGADWDHVDGAALKIAAGPNERVGALNRDHQILWNSPSGWSVLPGLAREITLGADRSAWCLSSSVMSSGDSTIHVWNGHDWTQVEGLATKIAVGPDGDPWIIDASGGLSRRRGEGWERMPGRAKEIAVGADGSVWCLSSSATPTGDSTIHVWNGRDWDTIPGAGVRIAAGPPGAVWLVDSEHRIYRAA
jgi:hypothetical protein